MNGDEAVKLIDGLGTSGAIIASSLAALGIKGQCEDAHLCPLAVFLKKNGATYPLVNATSFFLGEGISADLPPAAVAFVSQFDDRQYPALIAAEEDPSEEDL